MLLDIHNPISRHASRLWRGTVLTIMLSLVTALSLVTLQAAHSAQDVADGSTAAQTPADSNNSQPGPIPAAAPVPPPHAYIVEVAVVVVRVDHRKLAAHENSLAKFVNAVCAPGKTSKSKDDVVAGHLTSEAAQKLLEEIIERDAAVVLAEPRMSAVFEANPVYPNPTPGSVLATGRNILHFETDLANDEHSHVALRIHILPIEPGRHKPIRLKVSVGIDFTPQDESDGSADRNLEVLSSSTRTISYAAQVQLGESLIISDGSNAKVPAAKRSGANLIVVTPLSVTATPAPSSNTGSSPETEALRKVVEELKQEICGLRNQPQTPSLQRADQSAQPGSINAGRDIEQNLLRLDVEEAELNVSAARAAYDMVEKSKDASAAERFDRLAALRKAQIALKRAKLHAERGPQPQAAVDADVKRDLAHKDAVFAEKLRELDALEAQNEFDAAKVAYDFKVRLHKKGYLGDSGLAAAKLALQKAELAKKRADLRLKSIQPAVELKNGSSNLGPGLEQNRKQDQGQIVIHARCVEISRSGIEQIRAESGKAINPNKFSMQIAAGIEPTKITGILDAGDVTLLNKAIQGDRKAKIHFDSRLTIASGRGARFLSKSELSDPAAFPEQPADVPGQGEFRGAGASLVVFATLQDRDLIRLQILPEVSAFDESSTVGGFPGVKTRRVQTTVELRKGQTIVLSLLVPNDPITVLPIVQPLPGGPFVEKQGTPNDSAVLLLITPEIVEPTNSRAVPNPGNIENRQ